MRFIVERGRSTVWKISKAYYRLFSRQAHFIAFAIKASSHDRVSVAETIFNNKSLHLSSPLDECETSVSGRNNHNRVQRMQNTMINRRDNSRRTEISNDFSKHRRARQAISASREDVEARLDMISPLVRKNQ